MGVSCSAVCFDKKKNDKIREKAILEKKQKDIIENSKRNNIENPLRSSSENNKKKK